MAHLPDLQYEKSRAQLLSYEDARFNSLLSGVPNYYFPLNDYSMWGTMVRAVAKELARLEYDYAYDVVTEDPQYLTPADILRQFAAPLFINKSYPNANQSDQAYRGMLTALIKAYREGATVQSISDVITAYTGQVIDVQELYLLIGNGVYDQSDRNTVRVSVSTNISDPFAALASVSEIQTVAQNLYSALDLAKPAHVGLDYSIVFGAGEDLDSVIMGIEDTLSITVFEVETAPLQSVFTFAPLLDPGSPDTQIAAWGRLASEYFTPTINGSQYAALLSDAYRAEYVANGDGTYTFNSSNANDILLENTAGALTGAVSKAQGVLAPQEDICWEIVSDAVQIFELD